MLGSSNNVHFLMMYVPVYFKVYIKMKVFALNFGSCTFIMILIMSGQKLLSIQYRTRTDCSAKKPSDQCLHCSTGLHCSSFNQLKP